MIYFNSLFSARSSIRFSNAAPSDCAEEEQANEAIAMNKVLV